MKIELPKNLISGVIHYPALGRVGFIESLCIRRSIYIIQRPAD